LDLSHTEKYMKQMNSIRDEWPEKAVSNNTVRCKTPLKGDHGYKNKHSRCSKRRKIAAVFVYFSTGGYKDTSTCHSGGPGFTG